ncbi:LOW QUALITY PROTEIN: uncharacterized protein LOC9327472 [Arabidopsis lyrata subsp. lyrata]|uniref:LOW QUALITY PROTEIN: uncharacterized protein LOC9327472 n=1 Tax=Arabidopsis lyrata subsp. lyrata TaxID=81972 RepID=UPI000A29A6C8|nr:LOW QUALITY PROTEIN: uncharacterized protein LOC9327472 [Arabidopsis lyrata subsp. lyrata]|eukprot:XP_020868396.1 LOW QUALITY PROTEIN: uncharacterized protein LOC9327472 [Arabidopsis lyrata subsp. lyrata]
MTIHVLIPCVYVGEVKWLSNEVEWRLILTTTQLPIVVTVTSSLCRGRCAILDDQLARLSETYGSLIILRKVNILTNPFFKILYNLANAPVIIVFQTGKEIGRLVDDLSWGAITDIIEIDTVSLFAPPPLDSMQPPSDSVPIPSLGE